jgi:V8-like Glu-specific endopeptidase
MAIEITDRSTAPYAAVCYLEVAFPNGVRSRGSGVVVGPNDVLTALHVVFSTPDGGWATSVRIQPGADTLPQSAPLGTFTDVAAFARRVPDWDTNKDGLLFADESQYDLALLGLRSRIGDVSGWLPVDAERTSFSAQVLGYPSRGTGLMADTSTAQPDGSAAVFSVGLGLGAGASGGPILRTIDGDARVAGVLSSGDNALTTSRYAGLFGPGNLSWLNTELLANDDLIAGQTAVRIMGSLNDDTLGGNTADNIILGGSGRDRISGSGGQDLVDGGTGVDTLQLRGKLADYQLAKVSAFSSSAAGLPPQLTVTHRVTDSQAGRDGTLNLSRMERLAFTDKGIALDVDAEAGDAAALVGTLLGHDATLDARLNGIALGFLAGGRSLLDLAQAALDATLGANPVPASVLSLLYRHYAGGEADTATLAALAPLLGPGQFTSASLALAVSDLADHPARVALQGVSAIEYLPLAAV